MTLEIRTEDRDLFSSAWIADVKAQMRVEFDDDDTFIARAILRAAAEIEAITERDLVPRTYVWRPERVEWYSVGAIAMVYPAWSDIVPSPDWPGAYRLPMRCLPVKRFRAVIGGDDRSPAWRLAGAVSPRSIGEAFMVPGQVTASSTNWTAPASPSNDWVFYIRAGFETANDMPDMIADKLLKLTAHIYENREAMIGTSIRVDPLFSQGLMGPLWLPRC